MLLIGCHVNYKKDSQILGCLEQALRYGADTFMFYTGAPQNTARTSIDLEKVKEAKRRMEEENLLYSKVVVHAPYIINLANNQDETKYQFSISFLKQELKRCEELGIERIVLHPGSHVGLGRDVGLQNIITALNEILKDSQVTILLETMAGKGTELGSSIDEIKQIIDGVSNKERIGICLDTCHLNDAGYDVSNFDSILDEIDEKIGLHYVLCVHINDSKNELGAHKDRHENLGFGSIGFDTLIDIIYNKRLEGIPKILETPYVDREYPPYKYEIDMIRKKEFNEHLIEDIKEQKVS